MLASSREARGDEGEDVGAKPRAEAADVGGQPVNAWIASVGGQPVSAWIASAATPPDRITSAGWSCQRQSAANETTAISVNGTSATATRTMVKAPASSS